MKKYCYDCGQDKFVNYKDGYFHYCNHCGEIVEEHEKIGFIHALIRRIVYGFKYA